MKNIKLKFITNLTCSPPFYVWDQSLNDYVILNDPPWKMALSD